MSKKQIFLTYIFILGTFVFAGCTTSSSLTDTNESSESSRTSFLMNTVVVQKWYGENAEKTCDEIEDALSDFENMASLYIDDSEVSLINDAAGKEYVEVSEEMFYLLSRAKELGEESDGTFDITIGPIVLLWDVAGQGDDPEVPSTEEIDEALSKVDYTKILLNEEDRSVMLEEEGMMLDLGGIAKGYAAQLMRSIAEGNEVSGYLSIGGNMLVVGEDPDGEAFDIGIRDPLQDYNSYFAIVDLTGYTMASSSAEEIYFEVDGVTYHHILDPSSGYPGETDLLQVSVISEDGLLADALSTTIFLKGSECLEEYLDREDCMVLAVTQDQEVYGSDGIWEILTQVNTEDYWFITG